MDENKTKKLVGIMALISTIVTILLWILKSKGRIKISILALAIISSITIGFWIWYSKLPSFKDSNKLISKIEQTFGNIKKGDLE